MKKTLIRVYRAKSTNSFDSNKYGNLYFQIISNENFYKGVVMTLTWQCNLETPLKSHDGTVIVKENEWYAMNYNMEHMPHHKMKTVLAEMNRIQKILSTVDSLTPENVFLALNGELTTFEPTLSTFVGISQEGTPIYSFHYHKNPGDIYAYRACKNDAYARAYRKNFGYGSTKDMFFKATDKVVEFKGERFDTTNFSTEWPQ